MNDLLTFLGRPGRQPLRRSIGLLWCLLALCRLSPDTALCEAVRPAASPAVILVRGTASTPNAAEKNYARRTAERVSGWLKEAGVSHQVMDDDAVTAGGLRSGKGKTQPSVVLLCYNPSPPPGEMAALKAYVGSGGKLIVFYSSEPELAALMNVRLGAYMVADRNRQWHSFSFNKSAPHGLPPRVLQTSRNIRPVHEIEGRSKVIGFWEDPSGAALADPAWLQSDHGFWMSHVLLDSDVANKKAMLVGLIGTYEPTVWPPAAERAIAAAGKIGPFGSAQEALQFIEAEVRGKPHEPDVKPLLLRASSLAENLEEYRRKGAYAKVVSAAIALNDALTRAYAAAQRPRPGEMCCVWEHSGVGLFAGNWDETCKVLADNGISAVFPNMSSAGLAHYDSKVLPRSDAFSRYGDQLASCLRSARRHAIQVHVWKVCFRLGDAPASFTERMKKEGRLQVTSSGETVDWLCPSDARNRDLELAAIRELISGYKPDGIHLDYVRYKDSATCYCSGCRKRFEQEIGEEMRDWPASAKTGRLKDRYSLWRCRQTEQFVCDVSRAVRSGSPGVKISAAVWGNYPLCIASVAQDWGEWLKKGYVDFVCPMDYTTSVERLSKWVRGQLALPGAKGRIYPGIGVTADESRLTPAQTIEQILTVRREAVPAYVLFDLDSVLHREVLPLLNLGVLSKQ